MTIKHFTTTLKDKQQLRYQQMEDDERKSEILCEVFEDSKINLVEGQNKKRQ